MVKETSKVEWKRVLYSNITKKFQKYDRCFVVGVDNVRSNQMQKIRISLREEAELLMGKNTMILKVLNTLLPDNPRLEKIIPYVKENVGFVFTNRDLGEIRKAICKNTVEAPAKAGAIAPISVTIPQMNTGLGPEKTSFFQALNIPTKITRGTIELLNDVHLIKSGDKVGPSEASLLSMLKIFPFTYGLVIRQVYDQGSVYDPEVLDISADDIINRFLKGVRQVAAVSISVGHPTVASAPHLLVNSFKKILAISLESGYIIDEAKELKEYLDDPSKFKSSVQAQPVAATAASTTGKDAPAKAKTPPPESESDEDIGMGLFD